MDKELIQAIEKETLSEMKSGKEPFESHLEKKLKARAEAFQNEITTLCNNFAHQLQKETQELIEKHTKTLEWKIKTLFARELEDFIKLILFLFITPLFICMLILGTLVILDNTNRSEASHPAKPMETTSLLLPVSSNNQPAMPNKPAQQVVVSEPATPIIHEYKPAQSVIKPEPIPPLIPYPDRKTHVLHEYKPIQQVTDPKTASPVSPSAHKGATRTHKEAIQ